MSLFMDRHDVPGTTAKALAKAHQLDLDIQENYGCKALTYWFDEGKGIVFCLIEAPDKKSVEEMHKNSHGLIPNQIIEVEGNIVELFLGRILDPEVAKNSDRFESFINETAFRTIMYIDLKHPLINSKPGDDKEIEVTNLHYNLIRSALKQYYGREVKYTNEGLMASFTSVSNSVNCAIEIQKGFKAETKILAAIGLSTGDPVTSRNDFFGDSILLAKRLCEIANGGQIVVTSVVRDLCKEKKTDLARDVSIKILSPVEEKFLNQLMEITERVWNDAGINVDNFSRQIGLSKAQLYRKTTSLTGTSPNEFIRKYRLNKALKLIEKKNGNITEIAFESGFSSPSYFSKCFQKRFGILPSDYANTIT